MIGIIISFTTLYVGICHKLCFVVKDIKKSNVTPRLETSSCQSGIGEEEEEEGEEEENAEAEEEQDANDSDEEIEIEEIVGPRGVQLYRCRFCPDRGPFKTLEEVKKFMAGKFYLKVIKKVLKSDKAEKKRAAAARQAKDIEQNPKIAEKRAEKREILNSKKKEQRSKKISKLSEAQIENRKKRFQLKKQRREERKSSNAATED